MMSSTRSGWLSMRKVIGGGFVLLFGYMIVANFYSGHWAHVADYYFGGN